MPEIEFNEDEVLSLASQGDRDAFGQLYERYIDRIFNYVYYRTGNLHDAEDLTARVFQRAMNHIQKYTDRGVPFSAWLYRIAHNLVANWHRDRSRKQEIPLDDLPVLPTKGDHPERNSCSLTGTGSASSPHPPPALGATESPHPQVCREYVERRDWRDHGAQ